MSTPGDTLRAPIAGLVLRNFLTLGAGELLSRLIGFGATVYIARALGVDAYGIIGFGLALVLYGTTLVDAGLEHTGPREVAEAGEHLSDLASTLLLLRLVWATVVAGLTVLAATLFFSGIERTVLALYGLALLPVGAYTRWLHLGLQRATLVSAARTAAELLRVLAVVVLVRGPEDIVVVPLAEITANVLTAIMLLAGARACGVRLRLHVDANLARAVFRRAAPMAVSALLAVMIYNADLVFLRIFRDTAEVGLYLAGYALINFIGILGHVVALTLVPAFTRLGHSATERDTLFSDSIARVFAAGAPIAVGGALTAPLLIGFVYGSEYTASGGVLAILIWTIPFVLIRSVLQAGLIARRRQDLVLRTTIAAAASNVGLNLIAVPMFGLYGAAFTTVIAEAVRMLAAWWYARREEFPMTPPIRFTRSLAAAVVMGAALLLLSPDAIWTALPLGAAAYTVGLVLTGGIRIRRSGIAVSV